MARAFLLMPFDPEFNWLRDVIRSAGDRVEIEVRRADDIFESGIIIDQIRSEIEAADAVVAVCTRQNANVFYELGLADSRHRPILIARTSKDLPFDVQHFRAHIYGPDERPPDIGEFTETVARALAETVRAGTKGQAVPGASQVSGNFLGQMTVSTMSRSYAGIVLGAAPERANFLEDRDLDTTDTWFSSLGTGRSTFSSRHGVQWEEASEQPPLWMATLLPGPVLTLFWAPNVRSLGQQRGSLEFDALIDWWWTRVGQMRDLATHMQAETAQLGFVLVTQPGGDQPWITEFVFHKGPIPAHGGGRANVGTWKSLLRPRKLSEISPADLYAPAEELLRDFGYRHVEMTLHGLGLFPPQEPDGLRSGGPSPRH